MMRNGTKVKMRVLEYVAMAVICLGLVGAGPFSLCAEAAETESENVELPEQGVILKAEKRTQMKAEPDETAETLMTFQAGDLIFATGEAADGWYHVIYQGQEGYVEDDNLTVQEMDIEGLDAEMAANEAETKFVVEVVEKYRADARRSKIWGTVIIVLVIGIFGIGIFSAVKANKNEDDEKSDGENDGNGHGKSDGENDGNSREKRKRRGFGKRKQELEQIKIEDLN